MFYETGVAKFTGSWKILFLIKLYNWDLRFPEKFAKFLRINFNIAPSEDCFYIYFHVYFISTVSNYKVYIKSAKNSESCSKKLIFWVAIQNPWKVEVEEIHCLVQDASVIETVLTKLLIYYYPVPLFCFIYLVFL